MEAREGPAEGGRTGGRTGGLLSPAEPRKTKAGRATRRPSDQQPPRPPPIPTYHTGELSAFSTPDVLVTPSMVTFTYGSGSAPKVSWELWGGGRNEPAHTNRPRHQQPTPTVEASHNPLMTYRARPVCFGLSKVHSQVPLPAIEGSGGGRAVFRDGDVGEEIDGGVCWCHAPVPVAILVRDRRRERGEEHKCEQAGHRHGPGAGGGSAG